MVHHDSSRDLDGSFFTQRVRARRFEEEEGFSRSRVVEFLDVRGIVPSDSNDLKAGDQVESDAGMQPARGQ